MIGFCNNFKNKINFPGLRNEGVKRLLEKMKKNMLIEAEELHSKALEVSLNAVGEKALLTAKSYCNLGRLYQSQEKYTVIFIFNNY